MFLSEGLRQETCPCVCKIYTDGKLGTIFITPLHTTHGGDVLFTHQITLDLRIPIVSFYLHVLLMLRK